MYTKKKYGKFHITQTQLVLKVVY